MFPKRDLVINDEGINDLLSQKEIDDLILELDRQFGTRTLFGDSGFARLNKRKVDLYEHFREEFTLSVEEEIGEDLFVIPWLTKFVRCYFSESGGVYPKEIPSEIQHLVPLHNNSLDVVLFWKTNDHYYVKSDKIYHPTRLILVEGPNEIEIRVVPKLMNLTSSNIRKQIIFSVSHIQQKNNQITIEIVAEETTKLQKSKSAENISHYLRGKGITIKKKHIKSALEKFLNQRELDFYLPKNPEKYLLGQLKIWSIALGLNFDFSTDSLQKFTKIGRQIIEFYSQFNRQMVRMWEKPKIVLKSDYVITINRLNSLLGTESFKRVMQSINFERLIEDWKKIDLVSERVSIRDIKKNPLAPSFKNLPIDTSLLESETKGELIRQIENIDSNLDGWLIHSENFQALNTLKGKFRGMVQTVYIDPPFNLGGSDQFDYRTNYRNSSWLTLLENRIRVAKVLLKENGTFFLRCDHNGNMLARLLLDGIFGEENFRNEIVVKRIVKKGFSSNRFPTATDSLFFYSKSKNYFFTGFKKRLAKVKQPSWHDMTSMNRSMFGGKPKIIFGAEIDPPEGRGWTFSQSRILELEKEKRLRIRCSACKFVHMEGKWTGCPKCGQNKPRVDYLLKPRNVEPVDSNWTDIPGYSSSWGFQTENSERLLERVVSSTTNPGDLVLDFFGGSGTTAAVAHKLKRKWICVEMGDHLFSVILPRMKKVLFYDPTGISKEYQQIYNENQSGGFFKYYRLETYEQTLQNSSYIVEQDKSNHKLIPSFFLKDPKLMEVINLDENGCITNLKELYPEIDIAETLSNQLGQPILKIEDNYVMFTDGKTISFSAVPLNLAKSLLWWI